MPAGDITITVNYADGTQETYVVAAADAATLVKGDLVVKFKGKRTSNPAHASARDIEITRSQTKSIEYVTA